MKTVPVAGGPMDHCDSQIGLAGDLNTLSSPPPPPLQCSAQCPFMVHFPTAQEINLRTKIRNDLLCKYCFTPNPRKNLDLFFTRSITHTHTHTHQNFIFQGSIVICDDDDHMWLLWQSIEMNDFLGLCNCVIISNNRFLIFVLHKNLMQCALSPCNWMSKLHEGDVSIIYYPLWVCSNVKLGYKCAIKEAAKCIMRTFDKYSNEHTCSTAITTQSGPLSVWLAHEATDGRSNQEIWNFTLQKKKKPFFLFFTPLGLALFQLWLASNKLSQQVFN